MRPKGFAALLFGASGSIGSTVTAMMWPTLDLAIGVPILIVCGVLLVIALVLYLWPEKESSSAASIPGNQGIVTFSQSGGTNVLNVDSRIHRTLTEEIKIGLLHHLTKDKPVSVLGLSGNSESMIFANEIYRFLSKNGFSMKADRAMSHQFFDPPIFTVNVNRFNNGQEWHVVIGPAE